MNKNKRVKRDLQRIPALFIMLATNISTDLKAIVLCTIVPSTRKDANLTL